MKTSACSKSARVENGAYGSSNGGDMSGSRVSVSLAVSTTSGGCSANGW